MTTLLKNVYINGNLSNITLDGSLIKEVCPASLPENMKADSVIDCQSKYWALPCFVNMHTHSAMTLFRSIGSGLPLHSWLNDAIFPIEKTLSCDDVFAGASDAFAEMRAGGTMTFNDMYFFPHQTIRAAIEHNMKGVVSLSVNDNDFENPDSELHSFLHSDKPLDLPDGLSFSIAPHSIYAVSAKNLQFLAKYTAERGLVYHIHISETQKEREDCLRENGAPPVVWLDKLGILDTVGSHFIGAHALWLDDDEIKLLGDHKANVVHCPNSNLKLGSGCRFLYTELRDAGVNVTLGTDGCASSDNLDMIEAMKVMSLLQKGTRQDPTVSPADEVFEVATTNGYKALGLPQSKIAPGCKANFFLVDLSSTPFKDLPHHHTSQIPTIDFLNRLVYASHADVVAKTITE